MTKTNFYLAILILISGCQVYMDHRNEPLMLVTEDEWSELYKLSENTFVEETEELKQKTAGAGLTDND